MPANSDIPPYLKSYLQIADELHQRLYESDAEEVALVQERIRELVTLVANRDEQIRKMEQGR